MPSTAATPRIHATVLRASRASRAGGGLLLFYAAVLIYASLNPFSGWTLPEAFTLLTWPRYITFFDVFANVLAYVPFGGLMAARLSRAQAAPAARSAWVSALIAIVAGFLLSLGMETAQLFLSTRIASPLDIMANTTGAAIGAALCLLPWGQRLIGAIFSWRDHHFAARHSTDWGLLLLAIWFVAQLNPAIPFFEAGLMSPEDPTPGITTASEAMKQSAAGLAAASLPSLNAETAYDPLVLLPQAVGVALNVAAFALLVSLLLRPSRHTFTKILFILTTGLIAKLVMSALLLKAPLLAASLSPATVIGLSAGLLVYVFFSRRSHRWRAFWATLLVFAGGVMVKLSSVYAALDEALRLFNWPYGQLANFASLTRWLNEVWPLAALIFLSMIFMRTHNEPEV
jgi:VanZ family protein